ncbi:hypothetical protein L3X38_017995 [Prunus dulcis]|uniref:Uncharacterized protein n=1 Tax=Prunus dulcis TaxID=3755 RepID=A0AAD4ZB85_PRUDU|nr:hypothetical protein L3X38_017995 [Prunus dulcis]
MENNHVARERAVQLGDELSASMYSRDPQDSYACDKSYAHGLPPCRVHEPLFKGIPVPTYSNLHEPLFKGVRVPTYSNPYPQFSGIPQFQDH